MCAIGRPKAIRTERCTTGSPLETAAIRQPKTAKSSSPCKSASQGCSSAGSWDMLTPSPRASQRLTECHNSQVQRRNLRFRGEV